MKLSDIMQKKDAENRDDIKINHVTSDSRKVKAGDVFVAIKGTESDGHDYIEAAIRQGASLIIAEEGYKKEGLSVPLIYTQNSRRELSRLAALCWPDMPPIKMAVTGTNGKSSVAGFTAQLMEMHQKPTLVLGTLGIYLKGEKISDSLTTPDSVSLHEILQKAYQKGAQAVSLEASSHGLEQHRLDGLSFDIAAFTNLTRDHLDYHGNLQNYLKAKMRLFTELLKKDGFAIFNADDEASAEIQRHMKNASIVTYGSKNASLLIEKITAKPNGQDVIFDHMGEKYHIHLPLIGRFQAENAACSALMAMCAGLGSRVIEDLSQLKGVPGRMEYAGSSPKGGHIYVDYAHTPAGLETALKHARLHTQNRLLVVFGAGGNRDKGKRPLMGKAAHDYADIQYITDDNPRYEDAAEIRSQVAMGAPNAINIGDRRKAIEAAIDALKKDDILIIAGKGHEEGQMIGDEKHPFNDALVAKEILGEI